VKILRLLLLLGAVAFTAATARGEASWLTNYEQAKQQAKEKHRLLLLDFTGSDWCGWCIRLRREVFSKPEFQEYANKNLILMEVDFPRAKEQTKDVRMQNQNLAQQYNVEGFPTIIVLNDEGKQLGAFGYVQTGPNDPPLVKLVIAELEKFRKS
jgi:protein disulfide-isomerase